MTVALIGVFGAGGCGRGILPLVRDAHPEARAVFVQDGNGTQRCNGHEVLTLEAFVDRGGTRLAVAIADTSARRRVAERCAAAGVTPLSVRSSLSVQMDDIVVGPGALLSPWTTLTSNIRIGSYFHANLYSYVEHDCIIGDFVTFAPAVHCNGNVTIGDGAYVGSNAVIRQGVSIGAGAVVGMGAVVVKDVPAGATVAGNPARPLRATNV